MASFEQFIEQYRAEGRSRYTLEQMRICWSRFSLWMKSRDPHPTPQGGPSSPENATQLDIADFKKWASRHYKPSTVRTTLTYLRTYFAYLVTHGIIPDNPCDHVQPVTVPQRLPRWLNRNEQNSLIRTVRKHGNLRELTIITLLLHTGLRVRELCDLRVQDVILTDRKGKVIVRRGKFDKYREVPLNIDCRSILTEYLDSRRDNPSQYLFPTQRKGKPGVRGIQIILEKYRKLTGINELSAHALRHTFCHELTVRKIPLDVIARLAGHTKKDGSPNISATLIYTQPSEEDLARAVEELSWR